MKRLYRVAVTVDMMVVAESPESAEATACEFAPRELRDNPGNATAAPAVAITKAADIPRDWVGAIPYGWADDEPCHAWVRPSPRRGAR